eukprot:scaffold156747_cov32-Prasinocladus_malaysianus.AAC.2
MSVRPSPDHTAVNAVPEAYAPGSYAREGLGKPGVPRQRPAQGWPVMSASLEAHMALPPVSWQSHGAIVSRLFAA